MVYPKYGQIFRLLREQKKLPLSAFKYAGVSKPALSKFERGEAMMSFQKVFLALQIMEVSLGEFESLLYDYELNEKENYLYKIETAMANNDKEKLVFLYKESLEAEYSIIALAIKSLYSPLKPREIEEITELLYEIKIWGLVELYVFYFTLHYLSIQDISHLFRKFFPKGHPLFISEKHSSIFIKLCCKAVVHFSCAGYKKEASDVIQQLEKYPLDFDIFHTIIKNMAQAHWVYHFTNTTQGTKEHVKHLNILSEFSPSQLYHYHSPCYMELIPLINKELQQ